jgi:long-chain acyl-CoA synthetase
MAKSKSDRAREEYEKRPWLKWYPEGCPADIEIPSKSIVEAFDEAVGKWGNKTAVVFYGKKFKYKDLRTLSLRFAASLHDLGIGKGDIVAVLVPNCPQFMIAYFGILRLGATVTTVSPLYTSREVEHQLKDSGAKIIVVLDLLFEKVEKVWEKVGLKHVIVTSIDEYLPGAGRFFGRLRGKTFSVEVRDRPGLIWFQELIKKYPPNPPNVEINAMESLAALPYTGGTTGVPKGAMLTHSNILSLVEEVQRFWTKVEDGKEVSVAVLPFYHIYGQALIMLMGVLRGGTGIVFSRPDLEEMLAAIDKYGITLWYGVPTLYKYLVDHPRTKRINWKRLKYLICGADTLHEATRENWKRLTGVDIFEGYGMTETSGVTHVNPEDRNKVGSLGIPLPSTYVGVVNLDTDKFLPPGEPGECVVSGPQVMSGYWKKPEQNKKSYFEAGGHVWFRTGDMVKMDEEGYFFFVERTKDMIKYKGLQVYAKEIEDLLYDHPKIKEAAIIGVPTPDVGERVKAIVVPETDFRGKLTQEEVLQYCKERLAPYKVPKIVEFRGEVPKTDVGKVDHKKLRAELFRLAEE